MVQRIGGSRRKTRGIMRRGVREKGKVSISRFFQVFSEGDKVVLKANPAHQGGVYHRRFHGKVAEVTGKQGECYTVTLKDGGKAKGLIVHPVHLQRQVR
ncbi:50S ribosomal protein L21e [Candidatus Woesearchaeota archaeon]|nr:50S ribosomal protein L21e [Candidatus Woesearchaeota archaeon]